MVEGTYFKYDQIGHRSTTRDGVTHRSYVFWPNRATRVVAEEDVAHFREKPEYTEYKTVKAKTKKGEDTPLEEDSGDGEDSEGENGSQSVRERYDEEYTVPELRELLDEQNVDYSYDDKKDDLVGLAVAHLEDEES